MRPIKRSRLALLAAVCVLASGLAFAQSGGGCLQGTWTYYGAGGSVVGQETVGCGELDGAWGTRTANRTFSQGCAASM